MLAFFRDALVLVRGGGDLASGVIFRLHHAGFPVIVAELAHPMLVRRTVSFGEAVYSGQVMVEGVAAQYIDIDSPLHTVQRLIRMINQTETIPVLVDPEGTFALQTLQPVVVVDARMAKRNQGTTLDDAPLVVALGPGFEAGLDCHAVVETQRGHRLGRVIWLGGAAPNTGEPGERGGQSTSRVLRAPLDGYVEPCVMIGDSVQAGQVIATIAGEAIVAGFAGILRGLIHESVFVSAGTKIGDLDPSASREDCFMISDKALAIGGGVLEAVFAAPQIRPYLTNTG